MWWWLHDRTGAAKGERGSGAGDGGDGARGAKLGACEMPMHTAVGGREEEGGAIF